MLPSASAEPERYRGRPLLIILENYVIAAIGELPDEKHASISQVVKKVFGGTDDWMATVRKHLQFDSSMDDALRAMWSKNKETARQNKMSIEPVQFAKMVADQNFAHLIE